MNIRPSTHFIRLLISGTFIFQLMSCISTYQMPSSDVNRAFKKGYAEKSLKMHQQNNLSYMPRSHDQVLYYLDLGMLNHYAGNYMVSNDLLTKAEFAIEENFTKSLSKHLSSFIFDDRILNYSGEDYEDIYLNVFKALNYYQLNKNEDAMVEIRRVNEKVTLLQDKYKKLGRQLSRSNEAKVLKKKMDLPDLHFHNSALAAYISELFYVADQNYDSARIEIDRIYDAFAYQPKIYNFKIPREIAILRWCIQKTSTEICLKPSSTAKFSILAFCGQPPIKSAKTYWVITRKNQIIIAGNKSGSNRIDMIPWKGIQPGHYLKFSIPYMKQRDDRIAKIEGVIGKQRFALKKLENMSNVAIEAFNQKKSLIYLKTFIRAVWKSIAAAEVKQSIDEKYKEKNKNKEKNRKRRKDKEKPKKISFGAFIMAEFKKSMVDGIIEALEQPDLRTSSFFPARAYMGEVLIQPGLYPVKIIYCDQAGKRLKEKNLGKQKVVSTGLNLLHSSFFDK